MFPRFATTLLRTRMRGLGSPMVVALSLIAIVVASMFATMVTTVRSLSATSTAQRANNEMTQASLQLERTVVDIETGVRGYLLTNDARFLEPYREGRERLNAQVAELTRLSPPSLRARTKRIDRDLTD